ncbi:MAG TPA: hypothetical protein VMR62_26545 [Bryobacteraceae bacterium]|jgi:hypothetical protein|nr:hypothetical protein [Bryobacteraceae bacterium]
MMAEEENELNPHLDVDNISICGDNEGVQDADLVGLLRRKVEHHRSLMMAYEKALQAALLDSPEQQGESPKRELSRHYRKGERSEYVLDLLESHTDGMTPAQIREQARADGMAVNAAFPYTILKTMEDRAAVRNVDGVYIKGGKVAVHEVKSKNSRTTSKKETGER